ncbi:MAG: ribosomal protein S18-alanine N-acetyltransferase [Gemmatimonadales bacterium]|nr:ribosomal protein S18-alanine N-acetyltransferase [Gemmatimonadales bacterium]
MADRYRIRRVERADLEALAGAEQRSFSDPWSRAGIAELFENDTVVGHVVVEGGPEMRLAGYVFARVVAGEAEILNIAVVPEHRQAGLGRRLLEEVLVSVRSGGAQSVFLEVRESNEAAKRLYGSLGFRPVGFRADYYRKPREHALVLRLDFEMVLI